MHEQQRQWQNIYAQLNQVKGRNKFTACKERREGCERERARYTHIVDVPSCKKKNANDIKRKYQTDPTAHMYDCPSLAHTHTRPFNLASLCSARYVHFSQ